MSGELFISAGEDSRGERRWTRPFKGAGGLGKEELAAWCLFQRCQSLYGREGGRGTGRWAGKGPGQSHRGFLLSSPVGAEVEAVPREGRWPVAARSGRAVFSSHSLAQTVTRPGLLQASGWRRLFLASALGCAGGGRETGPQGPRPRADLDPRLRSSPGGLGGKSAPRSVGGAEVVGVEARARANNSTLLTNSLPKHDGDAQRPTS